MSFLELCRKRLSVRAYQPIAVEREKLEQILETARLAPSAVNYQPWRFIVVSEPTLLDGVKACYPRDWFRSAPVAIVVCANREEAWVRSCDGKSHADIDAAIAVEHLCLAAADLGLGSCWVCNFDLPALCQLLELPEELEPIAIVPIGYPVEPLSTDAVKRRKASESIIDWR